jgi:hypothetical protein
VLSLPANGRIAVRVDGLPNFATLRAFLNGEQCNKGNRGLEAIMPYYAWGDDVDGGPYLRALPPGDHTLHIETFCDHGNTRLVPDVTVTLRARQ